MICGNCRNHHAHVADVKACYAGTAPTVRNVTSNQLAYANGVPRPALPTIEKPRDGFYTVVFSHGDWVTIRLRTQDANDSFAPGETIASYLDGPDNESDYRGFAFVKDDGRFFLWKRFRSEGSRLGAGAGNARRDAPVGRVHGQRLDGVRRRLAIDRT